MKDIRNNKLYLLLFAASRVVLEEGLGERSLRRTTSLLMGPLAEGGRKPRKQITPEEMEERKRKVGFISFFLFIKLLS